MTAHDLILAWLLERCPEDYQIRSRCLTPIEHKYPRMISVFSKTDEVSCVYVFGCPNSVCVRASNYVTGRLGVNLYIADPGFFGKLEGVLGERFRECVG